MIILPFLFCAAAALRWPEFTWDHVPVYMHTCNTSGAWNDTTLQYFTRFPLITFEKGQGVFALSPEPYASLYAEDKIIDACQQIKAYKPSIICIFYYNSFDDWPYYQLHDVFLQHPSYWLRDNNDQIVLVSGDHSFPQPPQGMLTPDYRQTAVQTFWASECYNITSKYPGIVDGCFSDKPQINTFKGYNFTQQDLHAYEVGHNASISQIQLQLNKTNASIVIADNGWVPDGVCGTMLQFFDASEQSIQQLASLSSTGILVEAHASDCDPITDTLAAFLIGAGKYSYYACSSGWQWPDGWDVWHEQYDKPLGQPLGDATKTGNVYTRRFASGVNVTFDVSTNTGRIIWSQTTA
mmetsp:Transcript_19483/g.30963  ORF Transcript_19483/g.30963 Transcript_19483/m.30963 type:complete len:352 (-) Transcript_19483:2425-3480(-)